jgi:hypothetical protein
MAQFTIADMRGPERSCRLKKPYPTIIWSMAMNDVSGKQAPTSFARITRLEEATRDSIAIGIWLVVYIGLLFLTAHGQSKLMTAGLMFQLAGGYSTFLLCAKTKYVPFVHAVPYVLALTGMVFLCLAPDFPSPFMASLAFLILTVFMHGSIIYSARKASPAFDTEPTLEVEPSQVAA